jgi:hypothetical protein
VLKLVDKTRDRMLRSHDIIDSLAGVLGEAILKPGDVAARDTSNSFAGGCATCPPSGSVISMNGARYLRTVHQTIDRQTNWVFAGGTAAVLITEPLAPSTAHPVFQSDYVRQLETTKRGLEARVDALEDELSQIREYWPTVRRLIDEYTLAAQRVGQIQHHLAARYEARGALDVAKARDVLMAPLDEDILEYE